MTRRLMAVAVVIPLLALAGCKITEKAVPVTLPTVSLAPSLGPPPNAAMAGGACLLLDFTTINDDLGSSFDTAGAADKNGTYTCVVLAGAATRPSLTLSITATTLTITDFTATVQPGGTTTVTQLGKVGYLEHIAASGSTGPAVEVGWLSGNDRLIIMRYALGSGADTAAVDTGMEKLARTVDATTV